MKNDTGLSGRELNSLGGEYERAFPGGPTIKRTANVGVLLLTEVLFFNGGQGLAGQKLHIWKESPAILMVLVSWQEVLALERSEGQEIGRYSIWALLRYWIGTKMGAWVKCCFNTDTL